MDEMKKELEEVRKLKDELKAEIEEIRRERPRRFAAKPRAIIESPRIDLGGLTDSLEEMMEGLGDQIRESLRGVEGLDMRPWTRSIIVEHPGRIRSQRRIDSIPPERVARVISPLGSEERLRILDFLKEGGKTFNELEQHTSRAGSSLTHHLDPLLEAGYVIKGEVRGTYYLTVEGRLAFRLAQWLTCRLELEGAGAVLEKGDQPQKEEREDWK